MAKCHRSAPPFPRLGGRKVEVEFSGGDITGNGGGPLLLKADLRLGLSDAVARVLHDPRRQASCRHRLATLVRQRLHALALGYEDLNDHQTLRHDAGLQAAASSSAALASPATLCRWERTATRADAIGLHRVLFDQFVASRRRRPRRLVLDFDATDVALHGAQEGRFFHGYYDRYCYLPLYVFCGRHLLVAYLRRSDVDAARHSWAILALLVKALRRQWPGVEIVLRADSGFCRWRMLRWCERRQVRYVIGIARNPRLLAMCEALRTAAERRFAATAKKQRRFGSIDYAASTWDRERRVIVKAEHSGFGSNPRFVVTNLPYGDRYLYDRVYCARGDMENRIKDQQMDLFATRTSCMRMAANQFRVLLSGLAYTLFEGLRRVALGDTELETASPHRIRLTLLRIGAVVVRNTRRIRFLLGSTCPCQDLFRTVAWRLDSS